MHQAKRAVIAASLAAAIALGGLPLVGRVSTVSADHAHFLVTPGTCVDDVGAGQTGKTATDPGGHQFHDHVHLGPGGIGGPLNRAGQSPVVVDRWGSEGIGVVSAPGNPANQQDCIDALD